MENKLCLTTTFQQSQDGVRSMEVVGVPRTSTHLGTFHTTPYCDSWLILPVGSMFMHVQLFQNRVHVRSTSICSSSGDDRMPRAVTARGLPPSVRTSSFHSMTWPAEVDEHRTNEAERCRSGSWCQPMVSFIRSGQTGTQTESYWAERRLYTNKWTVLWKRSDT